MSHNDSFSVLLQDSDQSEGAFYSNEYALMERAKKSAPITENLLRIFKEGPFTVKEWADMLSMEEQELANILEKKGTLEREKSEHLLQIFHFFWVGKQFFDNRWDSFFEWLRFDSPALGKQPMEFLDNAFGVRILLDEIGRMKHGIWA